MEYNFKRHIDFLLENASPGIRYLVNRDILGISSEEPFMKKLQAEVLQQVNVRRHLEAQQPDGWFGQELHGIQGMDCHIGGLLDCGVEPGYPAIQKAVLALTIPEIAARHKNWFRGGEALDAEGRGGNRAVTAGILASSFLWFLFAKTD